ncbi:hypothetical protein SULI_11940 [Saccharolobus solfataricus]|nr:hypothetical protein [Saccharolobus solfataricus]AKA74517.1 hypothetical protein SULB_2358 [Saccharolobus solfataricus]AKA77213.1 hypothetical protein SULC_2355 [Saccharolobus solfataricus]AKA79905.1 hypothetical protein SULA_2357 [Saccharolobus solfataricus]AZF68996.1 hypothetical protein SULG_11940 [Saccharolobus solfataricus]AZF71616.1 hypothetical protein SULH_11940 [Saccharolobus solfataricus]
MREILKVSEIRRLIRRNKALIGGLPFSGKTTMIKKACEGYCEENGIQFIELPKKFVSIEELNQWKEKVKGVEKAIIEGRSYVIELLLGKVSIADTPSLQSLNLDLTGKVVSMKSLDAIKKIYNSGIRDDKAVSKILMYSTVAVPNYYTVIPKLVNEGIELYNQGKLDKTLEFVLGLKRLYYSFPKGDVSGEDSVIFALQQVVPRDIDFKTAWDELSETWKELVYYRLDSVLKLLPGSAERMINQKEIKPMGDKVNISDIDPFFVGLAEEGVSILLSGENLCIVGPIRSGKSTLANYVYSMANLGNIEVVDYNNYDLLGLKQKLSSESKRFIAVLTEDIYISLPLTCKVINLNTYINDFIKYQYLKENKYIRVGTYEIPRYYYSLYKLKYNMSDDQIIDEYKSDMTKYIINTIFGNNKELIDNYLPLLVLGKRYLPFPPRVSEIILKYFNRQIDETFVKWFSAFDFMGYKIEENKEIKAKENEVLRKVRDELIKEVKEKKLEDDLLKVFFHNLMAFKVAIANLNGFIATAQGRYSPIVEKLLYKPDIVDKLDLDLDRRLPEVCNSLKKIEDEFDKKKDKITIAGFLLLPEKLKEEKLTSYRLSIDYYASIYRILSSKGADIECLRRAFRVLKLFETYFSDIFTYSKFENKIYSTALTTRDEELIRDYLKITFMHFVRYSIAYINKEHLERIAEISDYAKLGVKPILIPYEILAEDLPIEKIGDPVDIYASLITFLYIEKLYSEIQKIDLFSRSYQYIEILYEKFTKSQRSISDKILSTIFDVAFSMWWDRRDLILKYINDLVGFCGIKAGISTFYSYGKKSDFEKALEYVNMIINSRYAIISKEGKNTEEITKMLFDIYKVRLASALLASRYEYKTVLQDIMELQSKANIINDRSIRENIRLAYLISKLLLYKEVEETIPMSRKLILYKAALALMGGEKEKEEFFKEVESRRIGRRPITDIERVLPRLLTKEYLIPVLKAYFYLKGKGIEMTELDDYLENETIGIPMLVTNKIFDKIYAKENRNKFIASLILFI